MCKGNNTTTSTTAPNPQAGALYSQLLNQAQNVAATPYQAYSGQLVAPVNAQQNLGIGGINQYANFAQPYIQQGAQYANQAAQPITGAQIQQYESPYTSQVVNATENQFNQQNAVQQSQLTGNAAAQGALGGDRVGVAQGTLAGQQQMAEAPVIAGLENQGYSTALQTALAEQQQMGNAAYSLGNLGTAGQNAGLSGASAQIGAGSLQQQTQQAQDQALYQQFINQQAYPFQTTQWLAGIGTGVGSQMGGTSSTTAPAPSLLGQVAGLGLAGVGAVGGTGGFGANGWLTGLLAAKDGGSIDPPKGLASGGVPGEPWSNGSSYVPGIQITSGRGAPAPPAAWQDPTLANLTKGISGLGSAFKGSGSGNTFGGFNYGSPDMAQAAQAGVQSGLSFDPLTGIVSKRGGRIERRPMVAGFGTGGMVRHYADGGGDDSFDDRWGGANDFTPLPATPSPGIVPQTPSGASWPDDYMAGLSPTMRWEQDYAALADKPSWNEAIRQSGDRYQSAASQPAMASGVVHAPSDNGRVYNLTDDMNAPGGTRAPDLGPGIDVADTRPPGLGSEAMAFAPSGSGAGEAFPRADAATSGPGGWNPSPAFWTGLTAAGLGMMASRSPFPGVAIGQGGLQGLEAYGAVQKQEEATKKTEADIENGRKKLELAAQQAQKKIELETKQLEQGKTPTGYRWNNGVLQGIPGGPADPEVAGKLAAAKKPATAVDDIDPVMLKRTAAQYNIIGGSALTNLGRGAQSGAVLQAVRKEAARQDEEAGVTPEQRAQIQAEYQGNKAAQRTLGTQEARMGTAAFEAEGAINLGRDVINKVPRTSFLPWNRLVQGFQNQTLDPNQAELFTRTQGIINAYSAVMARGANVTTDASRHRAEELLNTASNPEVYNRVLDTMQSEIEMAKNAPDRMRQFYMQRYGGQAAGGPGAAAPAGGQPGAAPGAGFTGRTATNPQTGQKLRETTSGQWVQ